MKNKFKLITASIIAGICLVSSVLQGRPRDTDHIREADKLSTQEIVEYLLTIRNMSYEKDYIFRFKLKHYPPRARKITYNGTLYGHLDPLTGERYERIYIENKSSNYSTERQKPAADLLFRRGHHSQAWTIQKENDQYTLKELKGEELLQPIIEGISLTYFDLLAPYLYWNDFTYEGPDQIKARPSQTFQFIPEKPLSDSFSSIEVNLDDEFRAVLKTQMIGKDGDPLKSMELISFKKTNGQYIPKTIDYRDYENKGNKSRIDIIAAAMNQELPAELFEPSNLTEEFPKLSPFIFDVF